MNRILAAVAFTSLLVSAGTYAADYGYGGNAPDKAGVPHQSTMPAEAGAHAGFIKLDTNKDGYLEKSEAQADTKLAADFSRLAKDGRLSESRYTAWMHQHQAMHTPALQ